jgi:HK97 gp10 family phage protein
MTSFKSSYTGIGEMIRSDFMIAEMRRRAESIATRARIIAPVGTPPDDKHPGEYKASFRVSTTKYGGDKGDRAQAKVTNDSPHAFYVEYGTSKMEAQHILLKATDAARD